jgi:hypothetical protein
MAQPSAGTVTNLTRCLRLPGFFPGGFVDQFLRVLPFQHLEGYGRSVEANVATSLGGTSFYDPGTGVNAVPGATSLTTFTFQRVAGTAQVDVADIDASADPDDQLDLQVAMRKVSLLRTLSTATFFGSGVAPQMAGLNTLVPAGQQIDLAGAAPTLANYHRLVSLVRASDGGLGCGGADALVMNLNARRQLISLMESGGPICTFEDDPVLGHPVLKFEGVPVYVTEGIPMAPETMVFAVKLRGPTGVRMLHVGGDSDEFGIVVDEVPSQMAVSERAAIVRGYYALFVPEVEAAASILSADVSAFIP